MQVLVLSRWRVLSLYLGNMLLFVGVAHIVPIMVSLLVHEKPMFTLALISIMFFSMALGHYLRKISIPGEIGVVDAYYVMLLSFLIPGLLFALPAMANGIDPLNAVFEGISAITTTGLSSILAEKITLGIHFLRSYYQWLGGIGITLFVLSFMLTPGTAAYSIYVAHLGRYKISPLSITTIRIVVTVYTVLTALFTIVYLLSGIPAVDAVTNAMTTISTGGFSRITFFQGSYLYAVLPLMFISAQPIAIYYFFLRGSRKRITHDPQLVSFTMLVITGFLLLAISVREVGLELLFQVISALSTTGYAAVDNSTLPDSAKFVLALLMIIGAGFGSSGGGLKQLRLILLFKALALRIKKSLLPPDAVVAVHFDDKRIGEDELSMVYLLVLVYIIALAVSTYIIALYGCSLADSFFEASSALTTTGLSTGITNPTLDPVPKIVLIIDMLLGRIEIVPFIIVVSDIVYRWRK